MKESFIRRFYLLNRLKVIGKTMISLGFVSFFTMIFVIVFSSISSTAFASVPFDAEYKKVAQFLGTRKTSYAEADKILSARREEKEVLSRLILEKQTEWNKIGDNLFREYGINPKHAYTYDATNLTIYLVVPQKGTKKVTYRAHRAFADASEVKNFLDYFTARQILNQQMILLKDIFRQKEIEYSRVMQFMIKTFGIKEGVSYRYDPKEGYLYEMLPPPPTREQIKAAQAAAKAKIDAENKKKREAEEKAKAEAKAKREAEEKARELEEAKREAAEKKAKAEAKAKREAEKAAEKKAKAEAKAKKEADEAKAKAAAKAKREAEKKARELEEAKREAAEKKAKAEAKAMREAEKAAAKKAKAEAKAKKEAQKNIDNL